jgi:hypothetical protein
MSHSKDIELLRIQSFLNRALLQQLRGVSKLLLSDNSLRRQFMRVRVIGETLVGLGRATQDFRLGGRRRRPIDDARQTFEREP